MNQVKEIINITELAKSCRNIDPTDLMFLLKSNPAIFWSWGASKFTIDNKKDTRIFRMQVNGNLHKGLVFIVLNGLDLFDVYLTKKDGTIIEIGKDLYFDMLVDWIDKKIEKVKEYNF